MFEAQFTLALYPTTQPFDQAAIIEVLKANGFIGKQETANRYLAGDKFLDSIAFLGCSPDIAFEAEGDKPYCYIELPQPASHKKFHFGKNTKAINCQKCSTCLSDYSQVDQLNLSLVCANCQYNNPLSNYNWRKTAFLSQACILIGNIYPAEAVPNESLLNTLSTINADLWKYAYLQRD